MNRFKTRIDWDYVWHHLVDDDIHYVGEHDEDYPFDVESELTDEERECQIREVRQ